MFYSEILGTLTEIIKDNLEKDMSRFPQDHFRQQQLAEAYASQRHARLDSYGQTNPQWRQAYNDAMNNYARTAGQAAQKSYSMQDLEDIIYGKTITPSVNQETQPQVVEHKGPAPVMQTLPVKEVYSVSAPFSDKVLKLFTVEADAITYAKGLGTAGMSDGTVTKLDLCTSLDNLTEVEKVELKYRSGK